MASTRSAPLLRTMNWRGRPLTSYEVMLQTIAASTSRTGLTVQTKLDNGEYPASIRISDDEVAALPAIRHRFQGDGSRLTRRSLQHPTKIKPRC